MKRWLRLFWKIVLWHFSLTVGTGLLWTAMNVAVARSHHALAAVDATYASFYLFVPFCQPFFWPLSDWAAYSGHLGFLGHSLTLEVIEILIIAFLNSLFASVVLLGLAWAVQTARTRRRRLPVA